MPNPVRPWRNFLTAWEKLDLDAQTNLFANATRTLRQLRMHRKDIDQRIVYWEQNLAHAREARRITENQARARERYERVEKHTKQTRKQGRFTRLRAKAARTEEAAQ
jgi:hypothetical protein